MLIWIRALLSTAAEIKTLDGREMLVGLISPPVTDWLLHNTSSLTDWLGLPLSARGMFCYAQLSSDQLDLNLQ